MPITVTVIGAAAVIDYIYMVEELPQRGQIKLIAPTDQQNKMYYCGGSAPNIACVLAKLGLQPDLIYPVGEDFTNSNCERSWRNLGVNLSKVHVVNGEQSGFAYLFLKAMVTACVSLSRELQILRVFLHQSSLVKKLS